jgi:drug/metabolite transporter (DMT)-like permease
LKFAPYLPLGLLALIWGYLWIPGKLGVAESGAFVWSALRTLPAYALLLGILAVLRRPLRPKAFWLTALVGLLQVGGFVGFSSAALVTRGAGHTGMLANTWQIWILLLAWPVLGERLRGLQWPAVGAGVAGLVLIIEPWQAGAVLSSLFALIAALCFALGAVAAKLLRRRQQVDLLSFTTWQGLLGSIPLVILAVVFPGEGIRFTGDFVWSLAYSILVGTALGQFLWLYLVSALSANVLAVGNFATPIVGVLASWLQLGEHISAPEVTGMVLVVLALALLVTQGIKANRDRNTALAVRAAPE